MNMIKNMLKGKKTYIGILMIIIGMIGCNGIINESELSVVIDSILKIVGIFVAVYGRYKAAK